MKKNISSGEILTSHLKKIQKQNPRFSIRALASKLEVSHSFLVRIFGDKASVPAKLLPLLIDNLKIDEFGAKQLATAIANKKSIKFQQYNPSNKNESSEDVLSLQVPENHLFLLKKWWNFAILDLLTCDLNVKYTAEVIARLLPVPIDEIQESLSELKRLGLVKESMRAYSKTDKDIFFPTRGVSEFTRVFYKQTLRLAESKLDEREQEDFNRRLIMGFSCAVNRKNIPRAKQKLAEALKECALMLADGACDDVYFVQGQLFSVLKK